MRVLILKNLFDYFIIFVFFFSNQILMIVSFAGTGISHTVLATYIYMNSNTNINLEAFQWVPVVSFSAMIFIASCGALPVPYVIVAEILPTKVNISLYLHKYISISVIWPRHFLLHLFSSFPLPIFRFEALERHLSYAFRGVLLLPWSKYFQRF